MRTGVFVSGLCIAMSLIACKKGDSFDGTGALDPVGREFHKQQTEDQASSSRFKPGEQVTLRNTQLAVFKYNPQKYASRSEIVSAVGATIVSAEGLFYKVKFENGKEGYISESDIMDPMETFVSGSYATEDFPFFMQEDILPAPSAESQQPLPDKPSEGKPEEKKESAEVEVSGSIPTSNSSESGDNSLPTPSSKLKNEA